MPKTSPVILIVDDEPDLRTNLAEVLSINGMQTLEAGEGVEALIAPGGFHMMRKRSGARYYVKVADGPLVSRHKPSVDVLFRSAARYAGSNAIGVIMTGMGDDGAKSMLEMKEAGAFNIAQDEESCVVFGMPKEAINAGAVDAVLPLNRIAHKVVQLCSN